METNSPEFLVWSSTVLQWLKNVNVFQNLFTKWALSLVLQAANTLDLLCFRHPFSAEEESLHHQYQKTKTAEEKSFFVWIGVSAWDGALPFGAFTDWPTYWTITCPLDWTESCQRGVGWAHEVANRSNGSAVFSLSFFLSHFFFFYLRSSWKTSKHTSFFLRLQLPASFISHEF